MDTIREDYTCNSWKRNKYYLKICKLNNASPLPKDIFEQVDKVLNDMSQDSQVDAREAYTVSEAAFTMRESTNMERRDRTSLSYAFDKEDAKEGITGYEEYRLMRGANNKKQEDLKKRDKETYKIKGK
ncbi:MAG TPA: hypothetical protein EYQ72_03360 [Gammaproteobacteria bacterium]|jgi:hypothetical protein|nr:hypothetical protein [Gammaproteobacteria bacterium]